MYVHFLFICLFTNSIYAAKFQHPKLRWRFKGWATKHSKDTFMNLFFNTHFIGHIKCNVDKFPIINFRKIQKPWAKTK